jgi:hypothetical protein
VAGCCYEGHERPLYVYCESIEFLSDWRILKEIFCYFNLFMKNPLMHGTCIVISTVIVVSNSSYFVNYE